MRIISSSGRIFRSRVAHVIALGGLLAMAACEDVTAPEPVQSAAAPELRLSRASATQLASLATSLDDMTGWSIATLNNAQQGASIVGVLNGLKGHLNSANTQLIQQDVTQANGIIASMSNIDQANAGPVSVALSVIQKAISQ